MKNTTIVLLISFFSITSIAIGSGSKTLKPLSDKIEWHGNAAIKIKTEQNLIYIDPTDLNNDMEPADLILITHSHGDHFSMLTLSEIIKKGTVIIAPQSCIESIQSTDLIEDQFKTNLYTLMPGQTRQINKMNIKAVPAYNIAIPNHPKDKNWCGYLLTLNDITIYHAGDTERIPEMKTFQCDIALLPLGQAFTMNSVEDAAASALDVKARIAIPIHYGTWEGTLKDAQTFKTLLKGKVDVIIKPEL